LKIPIRPVLAPLHLSWAGRDKIREQVRVAIARIRVGNPAKSVLMVGLRGVGKTVLLDQMRLDAERSGIHYDPNRSS
jgi:predicted AAA+ superfamily ATPase